MIILFLSKKNVFTLATHIWSLNGDQLFVCATAQ